MPVKCGRAWLVHVFPRPGFAGRPADGLRASDGRWRASVRSFCGFCVTSRCNFCRASRVRRDLPARQWREPIGGIVDASLKQRKGDPVQAELDSAMKRILRVDHAGGTARRPSSETFGPLGRRRSRRMSAATSSGGGGSGAYGLRRVCAAWGMARSSFEVRQMTPSSGFSTPRKAPAVASVSGPKPAISDLGAAGGNRSRPGGIALGGRGLPQGLGSASGLSGDIRSLPASGCSA